MSYFSRRSLQVTTACVIAASVAAVAACGGQSSLIPGGPTVHRGGMAHPAAAATPIQLVPGTTVGLDIFPEGDTATGGRGQIVDGIPCRKYINEVYHHHVHLSLFVNGVQYAIPRGTGMKNPGTGHYVYHADCSYFLHTHDATGIIHMESPIQRYYNLHDYFYIWGQPLTTNNVAGYVGAVTVFINGVQQSVDPRSIVFSPYQQITLEVGTPIVTPPVYIFPPGYP